MILGPRGIAVYRATRSGVVSELFCKSYIRVEGLRGNRFLQGCKNNLSIRRTLFDILHTSRHICRVEILSLPNTALHMTYYAPPYHIIRKPIPLHSPIRLAFRMRLSTFGKTEISSIKTGIFCTLSGSQIN